MLAEVTELLAPVLGKGTLVDATVGGAGHACALLDEMDRAGAGGSLLGVDIDEDAIDAATERLAQCHRRSASPRRAQLVRASYVDLPRLVRELGMAPVAGVLLDLGVSLHQLLAPERGFGFDRDGPIDMRFSRSDSEPTALELIRRAPADELRRWLSEYGQEPMSGRIARVLHERRRELATTTDVVRVVKRFARGHHVRATLARVFQALRIATNRELETVRRGIEAALSVLGPGGRLVVISYHSGEDRIVKDRLKQGAASGQLVSLTRKPLRPSVAELSRNRRARSAKLRAAEVVE